mmetsp:Transcript_10640/g.15938  ORF Transcript_10640/g.15938 Transcript_10640/m.15938 type:complete len:83 (-) Transcript_10640:1946-2194(-)
MDSYLHRACVTASMLVFILHSTVLDAPQYVIQEDFSAIDATTAARASLLLACTLGIAILLGNTLSQFRMVFGPSLARHSWLD